MFGNEKHSQTVGQPDIDTSTRAIDKAIGFLDTYLPQFPDVYKKKTTKIELTNEDDISQTLAIYLDRQSRKDNFLMVHFQYRYLKTRLSSDFGLIEVENNAPTDIDNAFFVIEAKWLPLPKPNKSREKEYVIGNPKGGGMERFKKGGHGTGLTKSAMVAYVQKENYPHWHKKVNSWIQDLIETSTSADIVWNSADLLIFQNQFDTTSKYKSNNKRIHQGKTDDIQLLHYWLPISD